MEDRVCGKCRYYLPSRCSGERSGECREGVFVPMDVRHGDEACKNFERKRGGE